jgi:hypothetical protein
MKAALALLAFLVLSSPSVAHGEPPLPSAPLASAGCDVLKAYLRDLIEHHRATGMTSRTALERALDLSYAAYGRCVMCAVQEDLIAAHDAMKFVLLGGTVLAASD